MTSTATATMPGATAEQARTGGYWYNGQWYAPRPRVYASPAVVTPALSVGVDLPWAGLDVGYFPVGFSTWPYSTQLGWWNSNKYRWYRGPGNRWYAHNAYRRTGYRRWGGGDEAAEKAGCGTCGGCGVAGCGECFPPPPPPCEEEPPCCPAPVSWCKIAVWILASFLIILLIIWIVWLIVVAVNCNKNKCGENKCGKKKKKHHHHHSSSSSSSSSGSDS